MNIIHIDDSGFQRRIVKKHVLEVFPDCNFLSLSDGEMKQLVDTASDFSDLDIVLTDLLMDQISGHEVIQYIRKMNKACSIAVLSSNIQTSEKDMCFDEGADFFIEKPLTIEKLTQYKEYYHHDRV